MIKGFLFYGVNRHGRNVAVIKRINHTILIDPRATMTLIAFFYLASPFAYQALTIFLQQGFLHFCHTPDYTVLCMKVKQKSDTASLKVCPASLIAQW